jgi:stage III sporulation protein SpoIIIAA
MLKEIIQELKCDVKKELSKLNSQELQAVKRIVLDRERTNYDSKWQAEYFYGDKKDQSKEDAKYLVKILSKYNIKCPESELAKYFLDGENPEEYFKNMK